MAYNGSVELISGLRQKNNGNFALVDAESVYIDDNTRLNLALDRRVRADDEQNFTNEQKALARNNIDAASIENIKNIMSKINGHIIESALKFKTVFEMIDKMDINHLNQLHLFLDTSLNLKNIHIKNESNNLLRDENGNLLTGKIYTAILDDTFKSDIYPASSKAIGAQLGKDSSKLQEYLFESTLKFKDMLEKINKMDFDHLNQLHLFLDTSLSLKNVYLKNESNNLLVDKNGNLLTGKIYTAILDDTFKSSIYPASSKIVGDKIKESNNELQKHSDKIEQLEYLKEKFFKIDNAKLVNNAGEHLINKSNEDMVGLTYLMKTDSTGTLDQVPMNAAMVGKTFLMSYEKMGLPILYMNHPDILTLKKKSDGTISNVQIICNDFNLNTKLKKLKVQGSSSQAYEKKNYTLTFGDDIVFKTEWGAHKKYVIKADWIDFSQMRNEIGAKIWGQIRRTRLNPARAKLVNENGNYFIDKNNNNLVGENDPCLSIGLNYGAIDAFPICVVINGTYWGLYSMTIPKDDWMANMEGKNEHEGIVCAEDHGAPTSFKELVSYPDEDGLMNGVNSGKKGFCMEYAPTDNINWMADSLNNLITAAMASYSTSQECLDNISRYIDMDSAIDYYIFNCLINNMDATDKNFLLDTWDGVKWYFAAYDMDGTFGNNWDGKRYLPANGGVTFSYFNDINKIMQIIYTHNRAALIERYHYLRQNVLSEENLMNTIYNYSVNIPKIAFDYEGLRWPERPGTNTNDHNQIINFLLLRCKFLDKEISAM